MNLPLPLSLIQVLGDKNIQILLLGNNSEFSHYFYQFYMGVLYIFSPLLIIFL